MRPLVQTNQLKKFIKTGMKKVFKCVCLNAWSIVNKKKELNIMVEDIDPHIIGITESWVNTDITDAELGLTGYIMFRRDRIGRRGGELFYMLKIYSGL